MKKKLSMLGLTEETATLEEMKERVRETKGLDWNTVTLKERQQIESEARRFLNHLRKDSMNYKEQRELNYRCEMISHARMQTECLYDIRQLLLEGKDEPDWEFTGKRLKRQEQALDTVNNYLIELGDHMTHYSMQKFTFNPEEEQFRYNKRSRESWDFDDNE